MGSQTYSGVNEIECFSQDPMNCALKSKEGEEDYRRIDRIKDVDRVSMHSATAGEIWRKGGIVTSTETDLTCRTRDGMYGHVISCDEEE